MENKNFDNEYMKNLLLFLAEKISGNMASVGFVPSRKEIVFLDNSRADVIDKITALSTRIRFCSDDAVAVTGMSVVEAKHHLNEVAAMLSGRHGVVGPLSFPLGETEASLLSGVEAKIFRINRGVVPLSELRRLFERLWILNRPEILPPVSDPCLVVGCLCGAPTALRAEEGV